MRRASFPLPTLRSQPVSCGRRKRLTNSSTRLTPIPRSIVLRRAKRSAGSTTNAAQVPRCKLTRAARVTGDRCSVRHTDNDAFSRGHFVAVVSRAIFIEQVRASIVPRCRLLPVSNGVVQRQSSEVRAVYSIARASMPSPNGVPSLRTGRSKQVPDARLERRGNRWPLARLQAGASSEISGRGGMWNDWRHVASDGPG